MSASLFFNPSCSKCRTASSILDEHGIGYEFVRYLDDPPTASDLRRLMALLGIDDPREMMRTDEPAYGELKLADASPERLLEAISEQPVLLERPIFVIGDRAVIGRPPERVLDLVRVASPPQRVDQG